MILHNDGEELWSDYTPSPESILIRFRTFRLIWLSTTEIVTNKQTIIGGTFNNTIPVENIQTLYAFVAVLL